MNKKVLLTLLAALMISGTAFASTLEQVATEEQAVTFEVLDADKDSAISKEEAAASELCSRALKQPTSTRTANWMPPSSPRSWLLRPTRNNHRHRCALPQ